MSYDDTRCPCGDRKPTDTMLCDACVSHLQARREMAIFRSPDDDVQYRRHAAVVLLALARGRKRSVPNAHALAEERSDDSQQRVVGQSGS